MNIKVSKYDLALKNTFRISQTSRDFQPALIVELSDGEYTGYGEAAATSYYGVTVERMAEKIMSLENLVLEHLHKTPEELWEITAPYFKENSFAQCALDRSAWETLPGLQIKLLKMQFS